MITRRSFFKAVSLGSIGLPVLPSNVKKLFAGINTAPKPKTNIEDALKYPRNENSMPGKFPGKVVHVYNKNSVVENKFNEDVIYDMVKNGMLNLTGKTNLKDAWLTFVTPKDVIGLKVNPVAGATLSTSHEIVKVIIKQLEESGIKRDKLVIWDRREFEMHEIGFNKDNYPGIKIIGTERKDEKGSFYDGAGKLYGEDMIDKNWYYWADCEEKYDAETLPYMVNEGKYSYYSKIATQMVDKIINIPILKNAGASVTLCLKNLAYGVVSNTSRLHKQLWHDTSAEVCAFPPVRDKVVLNIVDGIKGCFNGGPGADPKFFTNYYSVLVGTDPVAVDRIGYDIVIKKRIEEKLQKADSANGRIFMDMAEKLKLGVADIAKIDLKKVEML